MRFSSYEAMLRFNHGTIECPHCYDETDPELDECEVCGKQIKKDEDY